MRDRIWKAICLQLKKYSSYRGSNSGRRMQSPVCYHYTIRASLLTHTLSQPKRHLLTTITGPPTIHLLKQLLASVTFSCSRITPSSSSESSITHQLPYLEKPKHCALPVTLLVNVFLHQTSHHGLSLQRFPLLQLLPQPFRPMFKVITQI